MSTDHKPPITDNGPETELSASSVIRHSSFVIRPPQPFYRTPERQAALLAEARSWLGTPFSENTAIKGAQGGVSCVRYLAACHAAAGACAAVELPILPVEHVRSWHVHHPESLILDWLGRDDVRGRLRRLEPDEPAMVGDMHVLRLQLTEHHIALDCGTQWLHVAIPAGVIAASARDPELIALRRFTYRIQELRPPSSDLRPLTSVL